MQIANALGFRHFGIGAIKLFLGGGRAFQLVFFCRPGGGQLIRLSLQFANFAFNRFQAFPGRVILFLFQRLCFNLQLQQAAINLVQFFRF